MNIILFDIMTNHWCKIRGSATSVTELVRPPSKMTIVVTMVKNKLSLIVNFVFTDPKFCVNFTCWNRSSVGSAESSFSVVDVTRQYVQRFYKFIQTVVTSFEFKSDSTCFTVFYGCYSITTMFMFFNCNCVGSRR